MPNKENPFKKLINEAKPKNNNLNTPIQSNKKGVIKPIDKSFLHSLPEHKLIFLKKLAIDKKTNVRSLINSAIDEMYFK